MTARNAVKKAGPAKAVETKVAVDAKAPVKQAKAEKPKHQMTDEQSRIVEHLKGPSTRIRFLLSEGLTRSQIKDVIPNAKGGQLLYQHVRNVEKQELSVPKQKEHDALVAEAMKLAGIKVRKDPK